jgi:membrane-bound acyltransferase YfiQ involved in biofilm formation
MQCLDDSLHCMPQHGFLHTTVHVASYKEGLVQMYRCKRKMKSHPPMILAAVFSQNSKSQQKADFRGK